MEEKRGIVYVNKDDCTSCSQCADNLSDYFQMDENDLSESHLRGEKNNNAVIPEVDYQLVQTEIDDCPGECILWKTNNRPQTG